MGIIALFIILFLHWVGDFVLQTEWMATNKSKNNKALASHVFSYCSVFMIACLAYSVFSGQERDYGSFLAITFAAHFGIDYVTSRINKRLWEKKDVHNFFVSVGFDQFLHIIQLVLTYKLVFGD